MSWLLLTAGHGPGECQIAVTGLVRALSDEAEADGVGVELLETVEGPHGPLSALVALRGAGAGALAAGWTGTVRWTCPSPIRKGWPRKNWFVSVTRIEPLPDSRAFLSSDLRFETLRASGPGGQHVNKTESAVRVTHLPTGLSVVGREERSQHRNRALAVARLASKLEGDAEETRRLSEKGRWSRHAALERGNEVRAYEGERFRRVV